MVRRILCCLLYVVHGFVVGIDLLVVAVKSGSKLKVAEQFKLADVRCSQQGEDEFIVRIKSRANFEMSFKCETMQEQLEWIHAITNGVAIMLNQIAEKK